MARSSTNASLLAASFTGSQSESCEPRSTSSIAVRDTVNGTRRRTSGLLSRRCATTPSPGEVTFEGPGRLLFDLLPRGFGDRSQIAVQVVHWRVPFRLPMPSDPLVATG